MVAILPPRTDVGSAIGAGLGQGMGQGIARGSEIGFQRNLVQQSLKGLENLPKDTTPAQLASYLISASAGIPGAERWVGTLYQSLLPTLQSQQKASPNIEQALTRVMPGNMGEEQTQEPADFHTEVKQLLGEKFFPNIQPHEQTKGAESLKPLKPLQPFTPIGPQEESKIRANLIKRGITDPTVQNEQVQSMKQYQKDLYAAQKERFSNLQSYQEARRARDEDFFSKAAESLQAAHGTMSPDEDAIWKEFSRKYEDLPSPARFASTEQDYNTLIGGPLISFETSQRALPVFSAIRPTEIQNRLSDARTSIQDHLKRIDEREDIPKTMRDAIKNNLRDKYETSLISKDYGVAQAAYATRNLSDKYSKSVPKFPAPLIPGLVPKAAEGNIYRKFNATNDKYVYQLANSLADNLQPEDSLILARDKAITNDFDDQQFNQALNVAINSGRLHLSDAQGRERNKLSIPQQLSLDLLLQGYRSWGDVLKGKK